MHVVGKPVSPGQAAEIRITHFTTFTENETLFVVVVVFWLCRRSFALLHGVTLHGEI